MKDKKKNTTILWSASLLVIAIVTLILAGSNMFEIQLPDIAVRILGCIDIIAIPVLTYSTVIRLRK